MDSRPRLPSPLASTSGTLLGVWAHPDDEAYLSAGLIATAIAEGRRVVVVTATRGELGTPDPQAWPPHRLAAVREQETAHAMTVLGVEDHRWLGYVDGDLADVPLAEGADAVGRILDEVRPTTVVTFGPDGLTGHSDHRSVSAWATEAWRRRGGQQQLWYAALDRAFEAEWSDLCDEVGFWMTEDDPVYRERHELVHEVRFDEALLDRKLAALRAHASQTTGLIELVGEERYRRWWSRELFAAA